MFFVLTFLITQILAVDTPASIRKQISQSKYQAAFSASNSLITQKGILDADNILFYLRGYSNVHLGKFDDGISDLSRFLRSSTQIDPKDKKSAYSLRATAFLKIGNLEDAHSDATNSKDNQLLKQIRQATLLLESATSNQTSLTYSLEKYNQLLKICPKSATFLGKAASIALEMGNTTYFNDLIQKAFAISPHDPKLLEMKGKYHFSTNELALAKKFANICTNRASDPSKCTALLKSINNFQKTEKEAASAIANKTFDLAQQKIEVCNSIIQKYASSDSPIATHIKGLQVKVLLAKNKKEEAVDYLNDLIKVSPNNENLYLQRGELLLELEDYSGAMNDFQFVRQKTKKGTATNKKVLNLIEKTSKLQEKEKNVDYYTVLGLKRGSSISDVKSAYRKLVVKWHPDRFKETLKKKEAEKKMKMINRAYDVLSDAEKKRMYDLGQDPENPMPNNSGFYQEQSNNDQQRFYTNNGGGSQRHFRFNSGGRTFDYQGGGFDDFADIFAMFRGGGFQTTSQRKKTTTRTKQQQRRK